MSTNDPAWRDAVKEAHRRGAEDMLLMPEWINKAIENWLNATQSQPVTLADFIAYVGAVIGHPVSTLCTEENVTADEILVWMPSAVSDAMSDLMTDIRAAKALRAATAAFTPTEEAPS